MINKKTFTDADLDGNDFLVYTHNLNTEDIMPSLLDNNGKLCMLADLYSSGDGTDSNKPNICKVDMSGFAPLTGTWKLLLNYQGGSETTSGRRAFELSTGNPDDDSRFVFGKASTPSLNTTLSSFYILLMSKLGFLKKDQNLLDLTNAAIARTNLGVYSKTAIDDALLQKASLYQSGSGAVLGVANTAVFTPTADYHPATKKYADQGLASGVEHVGDLPGGGNLDKTISLGVTLSNNNYRVLATIRETHDTNTFWYVKSKTTTNFVIKFSGNSTDTQDIYFEWKIEPLA